MDIPRFPLETLLAGGGDCEDTAILFASLIKAAPVDWQVDIVLMDMYHLENPQEPNHVIVRILTGSQDFYIETTNPEVMQPYKKFSGWYLELD